MTTDQNSFSLERFEYRSHIRNLKNFPAEIRMHPWTQFHFPEEFLLARTECLQDLCLQIAFDLIPLESLTD